MPLQEGGAEPGRRDCSSQTWQGRVCNPRSLWTLLFLFLAAMFPTTASVHWNTFSLLAVKRPLKQRRSSGTDFTIMESENY